MNKEEILKMSQQENNGRLDERELAATEKASKTGMIVGAFVCMVLIIVSELVFDMPEFALVGWLVYWVMQGSRNIVLFYHLRTKIKLIYGIIGIAFAVLFAVTWIVKVAI